MKKYLSILLLFCIPGARIYAQCTGVWGQPLVNQTFGQGTATDTWYGPLATYAPGATTSTTFVGAAGPVGGVLNDGFSGLVKTPSVAGQGINFINSPDHTGNANGLMFLVNAPSTAATVFFEYTMDNLCPNTTLKLSTWILNVNSTTALTSTCAGIYQYPNMTLQAVDPVTNAILGTAASGNVPLDNAWHQYSIVFNNGTNSSVKLQLINNSVGSGCGNDLALDDITVQPCIPVSHVLPKIDTLICHNGGSLHFSANVIASPYNPAEYQWQYSSDGGTTWTNAAPASASTNYNFNTGSLAPGSYMVRFKTGPQGATGNGNCIAISDTSTVTISAPPVPPVIDYTAQYCTGTPFDPFTIVSGTNIKWYDTIGAVPATTAPVINTDTPGDYTWYVSQTTPQGCESNAIPVHVVVHQLPFVNFSFALAPACGQDTVRFTNTSQFATGYVWEFNDGSLPDTTTSPTHIFADQNTYYVTLKATNQNCTDSVSKPVDVTHPLQAMFSTSADTLCEGGSVTFTNSSTATVIHGINPSYYWDFGDGSNATTQSPAHSYNAPGIYHTYLVTSNGIPCHDTLYRDIYVDSMPQLRFTASDTAVCRGKVVDFQGYYTQNGLDGVQWAFGDSPDRIPGAATAQHAYEQAGNYTITLYADYRVCPDQSATLPIRVRPTPVINLGPDTSICLDGAAFALSDNINAGNPQATWLWSNGATTSSILVKHHGTYTATVTIGQCSTSDDVVVAKDCEIDIPNSFTPNGDGVNDYFFPRQFLSEGVSGFTMTVFNRWGQKVFETTNRAGRGWDGKFNDKDQPVGVYIYSIKVVMKNLRMEEYTGNVTLLR